MDQLVINGQSYPNLTSGRYKCYTKESSKINRMASGRLVKEIGFKYRVIEVGPYDCTSNSDKEMILSDMRSDNELNVAYLPDDGSVALTGNFICTSLTPPLFLFERDGVTYWRGISFVLEGVDPID